MEAGMEETMKIAGGDGVKEGREGRQLEEERGGGYRGGCHIQREEN